MLTDENGKPGKPVERGTAGGSSDRALGMDRDISRRDFLNGVAMVAGSLALPDAGLATGRDGSSASAAAPGEDNPYPPMRTGMRGSQPGSFTAAHALRDRRSVGLGRAEHTGETYDLVIVGGGLSGLAAAHFFHKSVGPGARVLILDNHDDVGGHARRTSFTTRAGR